MARTVGKSIIAFNSAAQALSDNIETRVLQSADAADLEAQAAALIAEFQARNEGGGVNWRIAFADLKGGGDGHTFVLTTEWVQTTVLATSDGLRLNSTGGPTDIQWFFYQASQSEAILAARDAVQRRIANLFDLADVSEVRQHQTFFGGTSQGTRFMGAVLLEPRSLT